MGRAVLTSWTIAADAHVMTRWPHSGPHHLLGCGDGSRLRTAEFCALSPKCSGGFRFSGKAIFDQLVCAQPDDFPAWETVALAVELEPWAGRLAEQALVSPGGDHFMLIAAGLEYILSGPGAETLAAPEPIVSPEDADDNGDDDLGEAGEDYLSEQGFDRRS